MTQETPLTKLRQILKEKSIDLYLLPRTDEYQSEYLCAEDERLSYISGFTGSNAFAVISQTEALVWTDGRYFLQAEKELTEGWELRKMLAGEKRWFEEVAEKYPVGTQIEVDGRLMTASIAAERKTFFESKGFKINFSLENLIDQVWTTRPNSSATHIFVHEQWSGRSLVEKIQWVREKIKEKEGEAALFTDLGEIAWLLNLRSNEIPYSPFFKSILIVSLENGFLYLPSEHPSLANEEVIKHLLQANITIKQFSPEYPEKVICLPSQLNYAIHSQIKTPITWEGIGMYRVVRTEKEINGFKRCHIADGIAMAKFWSWRSKQQQIGEFEAATYLDNLRLQQKDNRGLSFVTISGGGPNGAIIHYHPTETNSSIVTKDMIHLVDSGGQYLDGTTDVTRAFHFGNPTSEEKDSFTRVLLGNLDIERTRWPKTTKMTGTQLDVLARRHLWAKGLDFLHGTGHGVGYFGGVHEGPIGISCVNTVIFAPNMIVTNEPGYYENGKYGIRIENILVVTDENGYYGFENITLCPYDKNLIDVSLLSGPDRQYIDAYHQKVYDIISPSLTDDAESLEWLKNATSPL